MDPCQSPNEQDEVWVLEDNKNREEFVQHLSGPLLFIFDSKLRSTATMTWEGRGDQGLRPPRDEGLGHPARSAAYTSKSDEHERNLEGDDGTSRCPETHSSNRGCCLCH